MIKSVINYHKTVMDFSYGPHLNRSILAIMPVNIQLKSRCYTTCVYYRLNSLIAIVKLSQDCVINIVVNQNYSTFRRTDKLIDKPMCIKYLTVKKYTFLRRQRSTNEEINLAGQLFYLVIMFRQAMINPALHQLYPLIDTITPQKVILQYLIGPLTKLNTSL